MEEIIMNIVGLGLMLFAAFAYGYMIGAAHTVEAHALAKGESDEQD